MRHLRVRPFANSHYRWYLNNYLISRGIRCQYGRIHCESADFNTATFSIFIKRKLNEKTSFNKELIIILHFPKFMDYLCIIHKKTFLWQNSIGIFYLNKIIKLLLCHHIFYIILLYHFISIFYICIFKYFTRSNNKTIKHCTTPIIIYVVNFF
jgi:hypothetical protein